MIDFRYHIVSLVAVFLALAVGIVLGSGPLRTALVSELTDDSEALREELAVARNETEKEQLQGQVGEEFVDQAAQVLLGDALSGKNIAIIRVLDADGAEVTGISDRLVDAGATITANLTIEADWLADDQASFRAAFAAEIADTVVGVDATVAPDRVIAHALAQALVPTEASAGAGPNDVADPRSGEERARLLLNLLKEAAFLSGTITGPVDGVLFVSGDGPEDDDLHAAQSDVLAEVAGIVDEYVAGTVVGSGPIVPEDIPSAIRSSALLRGHVSTVTYATNYYGHFTVALAMARELAGTSGTYGYGDDLTLFPTG